MKYDGYRMILIRKQDRVRLISRGGHDWARRFPLIITAALKLRQEHFVIDGETVVLGLDGVSDFGALRSGRHNERAQLYAFDMLAGEGEDQRQLPLLQRQRAGLSRTVDYYRPFRRMSRRSTNRLIGCMFPTFVGTIPYAPLATAKIVGSSSGATRRTIRV